MNFALVGLLVGAAVGFLVGLLVGAFCPSTIVAIIIDNNSIVIKEFIVCN